MMHTRKSSAAKMSPTSLSLVCHVCVKPLLLPNKDTRNFFFPSFPKIITKSQNRVIENYNLSTGALRIVSVSWIIPSTTSVVASRTIFRRVVPGWNWERGRKLPQSHTDRKQLLKMNTQTALFVWIHCINEVTSIEESKMLPSSKRTLDKDFNSS